jgi:nucleoside-diphosphate-sugar epimerase
MSSDIYDAAVIGANGFVGRNLMRSFLMKNINAIGITRETLIGEIQGKHFRKVFFCAGNSKTFLSQKDPQFCLERNVNNLYQYLSNLSYDKFIYVSSVIVYPQTNLLRSEHFLIDISDLSIYGTHKYLAERYVKEFAKTWVILRPTGFFGNGLKKNFLFDLRNNKEEVFLKKSSWIDYMPVEWFCNVAAILSDKVENDVVNIGSNCPISVLELIEIKKLSYKFREERLQDDRGICFEKLQKHLGREQINPAILKHQIREFILPPKSI